MTEEVQIGSLNNFIKVTAQVIDRKKVTARTVYCPKNRRITMGKYLSQPSEGMIFTVALTNGEEVTNEK
ncbi:hypothetical protein ABH966_001042 [Lysinibacillus sp. RC46]